MNKIFEQLLKARGIGRSFLNPKYEDLHDAEELPDMKRIVKRLIVAQKKQERVLIYGDYDVDGITATAIMAEVMELIGVNDFITVLPDRFLDGYGMSERLIERAVKEKVNLVVTVDCGSNNTEIIEKLVEKGIDVIVTDHHEINGEISDVAIGVVNPKREDFRRKILQRQVEIVEKRVEKKEDFSGLENLSGAGVAFMVARALVKSSMIAAGQEKWLLDLAMIGTVCDAMILKDDNRIICKYGMLVLGKTRRVGLKELMRVAGVNRINTEAIGFQIGPRLNAAGRMETAELALDLLLTKSKTEAAKIAAELDGLNSERRKQQQVAIKEIEGAGLSDESVIVARGKWHEGIVGIIAGRLTERYKRPSFVLTEIESGNVLKGSGRSFGEFNLALALSECQKIIVSGGGHAAACGVKLKAANYDRFKEQINSYYRSLNLYNQERFLDTKEDVEIDGLGEVNLDLMSEIIKMEPFGNGNPEPVFLMQDLEAIDVSRMGTEGQHLRVLVGDDNGNKIKLVAFFAPEEWLKTKVGARVSVWINLVENEWQGTRSVEGRILKLISIS